VSDPVEDALISDRLARLERAEEAEHAVQTELLGISRQTCDAVQRLVQLGEARERRELDEAEAERKRLEASAEAETRRVAAEIAERQARGVWMREQVGRLVVPVVGILGALGSAVAAWASGLFDPGHHR
jgi:septal ring factor EnvC (AmiA/AmiB activator)